MCVLVPVSKHVILLHCTNMYVRTGHSNAKVAPKITMQNLASLNAFKLVKNIIANFLYAFS